MLRLIQGTYGMGGGGGGGSPATGTIGFTADVTTRQVNPDCGPYGFGGSLYLNAFTSANISGLRTRTPAPMTIALGLVDLSAYVSTPTLDSAYLNNLTAKFALCRTNGVKVKIRPVYNYTTGGSDASLSIILSHMAQLAPIWEANKDVITSFDLGWLGDYGEYHDGSSGGASNQATKLSVMQNFMATTPSGWQVLSRYPADTMTWFPTVITESQFLAGLTTPTNQTRLGMYNDGYLAGPTDSGTYDNRPGTSAGALAASSAQKRTYAASQTTQTLSGGEVTTFANTPFRTADSDATGDGSTYHMGFLNFESNSGPAFFTAWNSSGIITTIARQYGYRIQLDSMTYPTSATARGTSAAIALNLRNYGYARIPLRRLLMVTLKHAITGEMYTAGAGDLRQLPSNAVASTALSAAVAVPVGATTGAYSVLLSAPDVNASIASDVRYALQFANANAGPQAWDAANARFNTGVTVLVT